MGHENKPLMVAACLEALRTLNGPEDPFDTPEQECFNKHFKPIEFVDRGGQSIVLARDRRYVVGVFREEPEDSEYQQSIYALDIMHTLFPAHFPKQRLFKINIQTEEGMQTISGTVRQRVNEDTPAVDINTAKSRLYALLETIGQLGLRFVPDTQGNILFGQHGNFVYIDLLEIPDRTIPQGTNRKIQRYMKKSGKYTKSEIDYVLQTINKLRELKAKSDI